MGQLPTLHVKIIQECKSKCMPGEKGDKLCEINYYT